MPELLSISRSPYLDSVIYEAASQRALHSQAHKSVTAERGHRVVLAEYTASKYQSQHVKPYHAAVFVEPRLENARPSEWTTVSKDDGLMRDLLATYFTHEYHLFPAFHKDYFLEDMATAQQTRKRKTRLCSELLVNATLACACVSQRHIERGKNAQRYHLVLL